MPTRAENRFPDVDLVLPGNKELLVIRQYLFCVLCIIYNLHTIRLCPRKITTK